MSDPLVSTEESSIVAAVGAGGPVTEVTKPPSTIILPNSMWLIVSSFLSLRETAMLQRVSKRFLNLKTPLFIYQNDESLQKTVIKITRLTNPETSNSDAKALLNKRTRNPMLDLGNISECREKLESELRELTELSKIESKLFLQLPPDAQAILRTHGYRRGNSAAVNAKILFENLSNLPETILSRVTRLDLNNSELQCIPKSLEVFENLS